MKIIFEKKKLYAFLYDYRAITIAFLLYRYLCVCNAQYIYTYIFIINKVSIYNVILTIKFCMQIVITKIFIVKLYIICYMLR